MVDTLRLITLLHWLTLIYQPFWHLFEKLCRFGQISVYAVYGLARWLTSFNYNHTLHPGSLHSTGHSAVFSLLVLCSTGRNILFVAKSNTDRAATK